MNIRVVGVIIFMCVALKVQCANNSMAVGYGEREGALAIYPFTSLSKSAQFNHLLGELRCLVCQNQDLRDSNAALAKDLKNLVYTMVQEGKSDQEIMQFLTLRYGDFILFKPPFKFVTLLLWLGPLFFIMLGVLIYLRACSRSAENV